MLFGSRRRQRGHADGRSRWHLDSIAEVVSIRSRVDEGARPCVWSLRAGRRVISGTGLPLAVRRVFPASKRRARSGESRATKLERPHAGTPVQLALATPVDQTEIVLPTV